MIGPKDVFWDSCVFIRWLTGDTTELAQDIQSYIDDAMKGERKIHFSTILFAEVKPSHLRQGGYETMAQVMNDFVAAFHPIEPNPNVMMAAGRLRDAKATNPADGKPCNRVVGTADAIHLATCAYLRSQMGVENVVFHTFDEGKGKSWEGKCFPLLALEEWILYAPDGSIESEVIALPRTKPLYPQPPLFTMASMRPRRILRI
ncbi:type II toxin-antitoxin system VapC family toxin (plasmid) [Roseomonas sp. CCTCC AB2023176]|uniref:type II toxin-antitoxin system VapC family toxin n=1 Tax=Roseomonas sp. CCTCC AB2023176 TaxID=3342640 RepID=UPI0035DC60A9